MSIFQPSKRGGTFNTKIVSVFRDEVPIPKLLQALPPVRLPKYFDRLSYLRLNQASKSTLPKIIEFFDATNLGTSGYIAKIVSREGVISSKASTNSLPTSVSNGNFVCLY